MGRCDISMPLQTMALSAPRRSPRVGARQRIDRPGSTVWLYQIAARAVMPHVSKRYRYPERRLATNQAFRRSLPRRTPVRIPRAVTRSMSPMILRREGLLPSWHGDRRLGRPSGVVWSTPPSSTRLERGTGCTGVLACGIILRLAGTRPFRRDELQSTIYPFTLTLPDRSRFVSCSLKKRSCYDSG